MGPPGSSAKDDVAFVGVNTKDSSPDQGLAFERRYDVPYPSFFDPSGRTLLAFHGTLNPSAIPSTVILDQQGRVAASILGEVPSQQTLVDLVAGRAEVTPLDLGDWFRDTALDGSLVLAIPVALVAGLVSFFSPAWCRCCRATSPTRPGCPAPTWPTASGGRMLTGSLLFVLGFSFVFVSFGALIGGVGEWLLRVPAADHDRARAA